MRKPDVIPLPFFLCGVVLPWRRFNPIFQHWEWTCAFGYWLFVWRPDPMVRHVVSSDGASA